ncbi:hypothetical protein AOLI_G00067460 [Acnodon oligacanthus]
MDTVSASAHSRARLRLLPPEQAQQKLPRTCVHPQQGSESSRMRRYRSSPMLEWLGAHVLDIAKRLPSALSKRNAFKTVVIQVRTNDISDRRSEVLREHYQTDTRIVISGPLPTYRMGSEQFNRLFALQS